MSEAPNDADIEAQALAAMEPDAEKAATPAEEAKAADPASRLAEVAKKIGHASREEWKGDPDDYLEAPEFILKAAGEVLPSMRKSLEEANEKIKGLTAAVKSSIAHMSKADERAYTKARADLDAELEQYATAGNAKAVKEVTDDILALDREAAARPKPDDTAQGNPDFAAWRDDNEWYGKDKPLSAAFDAICADVREEGYATAKVGLKEALSRLKAEYPDKFKDPDAKPPENPNRRGPAAVEGAGGQRRAAGKSFSDMPREAQEMCLDLMKLSKTITKESYAREHFAEDQR